MESPSQAAAKQSKPWPSGSGRKNKRVETPTGREQSPSLGYGEDDFLSLESNRVKMEDKGTERAEEVQSRRRRSHGRLHSEFREGCRRERKHEKFHSNRDMGRGSFYRSPHPSTYHHIRRPFMGLPSPVADLVSHCVDANEQIYRHALQLADQIVKSHKKEKRKMAAAAGAAEMKNTAPVSLNCGFVLTFMKCWFPFSISDPTPSVSSSLLLLTLLLRLKLTLRSKNVSTSQTNARSPE